MVVFILRIRCALVDVRYVNSGFVDLETLDQMPVAVITANYVHFHDGEERSS